MALGKAKIQIAWGTVIGGVLVAIIVNLIILPIRENSKARAALALTVHDLRKDVDELKQWQRDMIKWKERQIAITGVSTRRVMLDMPSPETPDTTH